MTTVPLLLLLLPAALAWTEPPANQSRRTLWFATNRSVHLRMSRGDWTNRTVVWRANNVTLANLTCPREQTQELPGNMTEGPDCDLVLWQPTDNLRVTGRDQLGNMERLRLSDAGWGLVPPVLHSFAVRRHGSQRLAVCLNPNDANATRLSWVYNQTQAWQTRVDSDYSSALLVVTRREPYHCVVTRGLEQAVALSPQLPSPRPCGLCPACPARRQCPLPQCPCQADQCDLDRLWPGQRLQRPYLSTVSFMSMLACLCALLINGAFFTLLWCLCPSAAPGHRPQQQRARRRQPQHVGQEMQALARAAVH